MVEHQSGTLSEIDETKAKTTLEENEGNKELVAESLDALEEVLQGEDVKQPGTDQAIVPDLTNEEWLEQLNEGETFNSPDNGVCPRLKGLRRLARPYIQREYSRVQLMVVPRQIVRTLNTYNAAGEIMSSSEEVGAHNYPMASVTFSIVDTTRRQWTDSADAYYSNCNELGHYPTAVASARAEARVLRKMLGITALAAEELTDKQAGEELAPDDDKPIKGSQIKLVNKILQDLDGIYTIKEMFDAITAREVYNVDDLTTGEARQALRLLQNKKKALKKKGGKK